MNSIRKLPVYFSIIAFIVSVTVCIIKSISPTATLQRTVASVVIFYVLGYCIQVVLLKDADGMDKEKDGVPLLQATDQEFEEIEFPVIEAEEQDIPDRG